MEPRWLTEFQKEYCESLPPKQREAHMWHLNSCMLSKILEHMQRCEAVPDFGQKKLEEEFCESERNRLIAYSKLEQVTWE